MKPDRKPFLRTVAELTSDARRGPELTDTGHRRPPQHQLAVAPPFSVAFRRHIAFLAAMHEITLSLHNLLRWIAVLLPLLILIRSAMTYFQKSGPSGRDIRLIGINAIVYDVQFVIGMLLYLFLSPVTRSAFHDFKAAMKTADLRFFAVEHIALMVIAVTLAHLLKILPAKKKGAQRSLMQMVFSATLLIVLAIGIPWFRPLMP